MKLFTALAALTLIAAPADAFAQFDRPTATLEDYVRAQSDLGKSKKEICANSIANSDTMHPYRPYKLLDIKGEIPIDDMEKWKKVKAYCEFFKN